MTHHHENGMQQQLALWAACVPTVKFTEAENESLNQNAQHNLSIPKAVKWRHFYLLLVHTANDRPTYSLHWRKLATGRCIVSPSNTVCETTLPYYYYLAKSWSRLYDEVYSPWQAVQLGPPIPTAFGNTGISVFKKINTGIPVLIPVL